MSADLCFTMDSSFFFFFRQLLSALAERNSTKTGHMLGSECNLKMSEISGIKSPYKSGAQKHLFQPLHNLTATFTAYIFGKEQVINKRTSELATRTGLLHRLETTWT